MNDTRQQRKGLMVLVLSLNAQEKQNCPASLNTRQEQPGTYVLAQDSQAVAQSGEYHRMCDGHWIWPGTTR